MRAAVLSALLVLALGAVLAVGMGGVTAPPNSLQRYFAAHGIEETGSINLVSSIYLGYRAFDTLGETVVLFLAVAGVMALQGGGKR
jgi:multicomponent Na+:H+ antiporter subunit B